MWCTADKIEQIERGETAVSQKDQISIRRPSSDQLNDLPGTISQPLVSAVAPGVIALRRTQHRQKWQAPNAAGPRNLDQQHRAQPSQAARLNEVRLRRPNRITIDSFSFDLRSTTSLERIVDSDHQLTVWRKGGDQQAQQDTARRQGRPARPIQDSMVVDETFLLAQSHHAQASSHSSLAKRQNCSNQQDLGVFPDRLGEQRRKLYNQWQQLGRQCLQLKTSLGKSGLQLTRSADTFSKIKNGQSRA